MTDRPIFAVAHNADGTGAEPWVEALQDELPHFDVRPIEAVDDAGRVHYAAAWRHKPGALRNLPSLQAIFSLGAGVDHLLADPSLPAGIPLIRVVDPDLTGRMSEWVVLNVLLHHRQVRLYDWHQHERLWAEDSFQPAAKDVRVGIMGLGVLGGDAAVKLAMIGFDVAGWSRSPKRLDGIATFAGAAELDAFLGRTQILVVMLPLTPNTRSILDHALFNRLARDSHYGGPILINAGRGGLQNEADILAALDDGTLRAASLDVFETEPLPADSPLWRHPAVTVTPHNAAISSPGATAAFIAGEIDHLEAGGAPRHCVERDRSY